MPEIPIIKGSNFILRELNPEKDKNSLVKNINEPDILNRLTIDYPYTEENWEALIEKYQKIKEDKISNYMFVIDIKGEAVGSLNLAIDKKQCWKHVGKFAYWIAKKYWGQGITTEAVGLVSDFAFRKLGLKKLKIDFLEDNKGSARVAEKNGFKFEAKLVKEAFKENKYQNLIITAKFTEGF